MSRMICRSLPVVASLLMLTGVTAAQQSAHVHGIATLNLAMEGDELEIEFVSPAGNIVGFEHEAVTATERRAIRDALEQLRKGNELFDLPLAASCSLHVAEVEHGHGEEEKREDGHGQDAEHDDGDEHGHAGDEGDTHSEFHARYRCECNGSAIETIGVRLFEYWPRIEAIRVQALTPDGQFGGVAKADDPVIRLR
ncbi:MAG: DUF2796 domain-containing protein [Gammaproteobacteria bacterium]|nr:DUF2796 domain-containing protein [Gammaproteobacteria bacterium]